MGERILFKLFSWIIDAKLKTMFSQSEQRQLPYRMRVFHEVVRLGSFTAAAEHLGHTKSAISAYISQLESLLGVRLLNRSTRRLHLTEAGTLFARRCAAMALQQEQALLELGALSEEPAGRLAITAPHLFATLLLPAAIAELCHRYPGLAPELVLSDERLDPLEHKLDLAISVGTLPDSRYHALPLGTLSFLLVAAPDYLQRHPIRQPEDLLGATLIRLPWQSHWQRGEERTPLQAGRELRVNTSAAALGCARAGAGLALLSAASVADELARGELVHLLPEWHGGVTPVYAVHGYGGQLPLVLRTLTELLREAIARLPGGR